MTSSSRALRLPFGGRTTGAEILDGVDLSGRRMIVTGGASGIGAETTRALAAAGAQVTVAVRDLAPVGPLVAEFGGGPGNGLVRAALLDLADPASVTAFAAAWEGPLHALVANAAIMAVPQRTITSYGWELQLATNFLGHFLLANALRPALCAAGAARVVLVSSGAHRDWPVELDDPHFDRRPYDPWAAYGQSKSADVLLAVAIARRWVGDGITANTLNPGYVHTRLQRHVDPATMRAGGWMDAAGDLLHPAYFKTPAQGASTSVLLAGSPLVADVNGGYFEDNQLVPVAGDGSTATGDASAVAAHALDAATAQRLWNWTERSVCTGQPGRR
ncbi:SDR family NAD(P)-dependent oxidoreductase [Micromonospora sp. NBC_01813]|uniref:SDR family NAD(P)-dependent oxidoreductase n=1 Tax=Micromonospora sp. NBC_01813 TaxID=2975988 RepID=UPI002DDC1E80|nr:SDR family NAD(P)-dependent oxidoreductase [Micromonospora sp. NBC_01813]WSA09397.1 SDR family NAD(P)-dependent oxidoreductase [Micromonospora sp. NBC_01813]